MQDESWWLASDGTSVGFVPSNYVSRVDGGEGAVMAVPAAVQAVHLLAPQSVESLTQPPATLLRAPLVYPGSRTTALCLKLSTVMHCGLTRIR